MTKTLQEKRREIRNGERPSDWKLVTSRVGFWEKVDKSLRIIIDDWIRNHQHVIHSPLKGDTVRVTDDITGNVVHKNKLLLQCSIRELYCDMYSAGIGLGEKVLDENVKHLVSDTMFRALLPPELRVVTTNYKQSCCCELCCFMYYLQAGINRFRVITLGQLK